MSTITPLLDSLFRLGSDFLARRRETRAQALQPATLRTGLDFERFLSRNEQTGFRPFCDKRGRLDLRRLMQVTRTA